MEYEKSGEKFQFGFGSTTAAGTGNIAKAQPVPKEIKTKHNKNAVIRSAAKAAVLSALVLLKHKRRRKK